MKQYIIFLYTKSDGNCLETIRRCTCKKNSCNQPTFFAAITSMEQYMPKVVTRVDWDPLLCDLPTIVAYMILV